MTYFAIIGHNPQLSCYELQLSGANDITLKNKHIITFTPHKSYNLKNLAGSIKTGRVVTRKDLNTILADTSLIGALNKEFAQMIKNIFPSIKRFKLTDLLHTDKEVKEQGKEIINIDGKVFGIVEDFQNIQLYETIDFQKPFRGMSIGMMPSKLAHILINIAIYHQSLFQKTSSDPLTIYDPFCGFGTTNMIANACGFDTIGSDINISQAKHNTKRRKENNERQNGTIHYPDFPYPDHESKITLFKHDITQPLIKPFLQHANTIVSEGRLGPICKSIPPPSQQQDNYKKILTLYAGLLTSLATFHHSGSPTVMVICVPRYMNTKQIQKQQQTINLQPEDLYDYFHGKEKTSSDPHPGNQFLGQLSNIAHQHQRNILDPHLMYARASHITARKILIITTQQE